MLIPLLLGVLFCIAAKEPQEHYQILKQNLEKARELNNHEELAIAYYELAVFEEIELGEMTKSFDHFTSSANYWKLVENLDAYFDVQFRIAEQLSKEQKFDASISLYEKASKYYEANENALMHAKSLLRISEIYGDQLEIEMQNEVLEKVRTINKEIDDTVIGLEIKLQEIQQFYHEKRINKALENAFEIFKISDQINNRYYTCKSLYHIGLSNLFENENVKAVKYMRKSLEYLDMQPMDPFRYEMYNNLSKAYSGINQFEKAYEFTKRASALNDSILDRDRAFAINNLTTKYETREAIKENKLKERDLEFAQNKNEQQERAMGILLFGLGLLSLAIYYIVRFYTQRIKATRIINTQRTEISSQKINELENRLKIKSMQSMIEGQEIERERIARDLHDSLGGLLSAIKLQFGSLQTKSKGVSGIPSYNKANELLDTAVHEVRSISQNLQPGALHNLGLVASLKDLVNRAQSTDGPDIDLQVYDMPEKLDSMVALNIYRIIQELLNNALKYAKAEEILIQINREDDNLVVLFEDDGVGFDAKNLKSKGMGMENLKSRVNYLKGELSIDSRPNEGSSFMIHLNYFSDKENQLKS